MKAPDLTKVKELLRRIQELLQRFGAEVRRRSLPAIAWVRRLPRPVLAVAGALVGLALITFFAIGVYYIRVVSETMNGRRWSLPTRLYSDVWVVRTGDRLGLEDVKRRLERLRYTQVEQENLSPGQLQVLPEKSRIVVFLNDHETAYGRSPGFRARIDFTGRQVYAVSRAEDGEKLPFVVFEPEVVGSVFDRKMEDRTLVKLSEVPKVVVDAIVTTEDRDFFSHRGISFRRIVGAAVRDIRRGELKQGGSTLTQQLVKNMFLTHARTFRRKAVEALMAMALEAKYDKTEILEAYLNEIYLGQRGSISVTGVEEASKLYFGKSVRKLQLHEAALLAGLIASPGRFSPFRNADSAKERRAFVLRNMLELGKIDQAAYKAALDAPLTSVAKAGPGIVAPHFVDFVLAQVKEEKASLETDGLSIFTTLDPDMQAAAQAAVQRGLADLEKRFKRLRPKPGQEALQAAVIALDPATGSVRVLVGGRDYQLSQFNRVVQAKRQPGSLFKPYVYLAALQKRDLSPPITPATRLLDARIDVTWGKGEDQTWSPRNYDGQFRGMVTAREALEQSLNIPTVRVALSGWEQGRTILSDVVDLARRAGISSPLRAYPSLALGAFEVSPLEIAAAYAPFANGGVRMKPNALLGLVGPNGRRLETHDEPLERVADADAVTVLDSMLQGVVERGTAAGARRLGAQGIFAGKTGTTNDGRDAWFIGFSPRLLVAVWVGFDDNRGLDLSGAMAALPIFADFVRRLPGHYFQSPFPSSPGVVKVTIDPETGYLVNEACPRSLEELFLAGTEPTQRCPTHQSGGWSFF